MKSVALVAVPLGVVTVMRPVLAPVGTVVLISVAETTAKLAVVPLKRTLVVPVKFVPLTVTAVPTGPLAGENEVIVGPFGAVTVKSVALVAVPFAVVTVMRPVVAPVGTVVLISVAETTVKLAVVPLKRTLVAPVKFVPLTVTAVATGPLLGLKDVIVGGWVTVKSLALVAVPLGVVTVMRPWSRRWAPWC